MDLLTDFPSFVVFLKRVKREEGKEEDREIDDFVELDCLFCF